MKIERAIAVIKRMKGPPNRRGPHRSQHYTTTRIFMSDPWHWDNASPRERAAWIRLHHKPGAFGSKPLSDEQVCELFKLTHDGLIAIAHGKDWHPEFERLSP